MFVERGFSPLKIAEGQKGKTAEGIAYAAISDREDVNNTVPVSGQEKIRDNESKNSNQFFTTVF